MYLDLSSDLVRITLFENSSKNFYFISLVVRIKPSHQPEFAGDEVWSMKKYIMENMIASFKKIFKELTFLKEKFTLYTSVRTSAT